MSNTSEGYGPVWLAPRYSTYVVIKAPKSRHSDPRNSHIASFVLGRPVLVCSSTCTGRAAWAAVSAMAQSATEGSSAQPVNPITRISAPAPTSHHEYMTP